MLWIRVNSTSRIQNEVAKVINNSHFFFLFDRGLPWMCLRTGLSGWTEAGEVINAQDPPHVSVPAHRSVPTKPAVIPRTVFYLGFWVYVKEGTLFVMTGVEARVEITFGHLAHVILVKKLTLISLFT